MGDLAELILEDITQRLVPSLSKFEYLQDQVHWRLGHLPFGKPDLTSTWLSSGAKLALLDHRGNLGNAREAQTQR